MKYCLVILLQFSLAPLLLAQGFIEPTWMILDSANGKGDSEAWGIDVDSKHQVYWTTSNNSKNEGLDIYCYKFGRNGNRLWSDPFVYGGPGTQQAYITRVQDTFLYIGGRSCAGLLNTCDMLLLKVDKDKANLIWDKTKDFSANAYDELDGLAFMHDGIYCGGWAQELDATIFHSDIGLWKLNYEGESIWTKAMGEKNTAEHQDGHFVVDTQFIYAAGIWGGKGIANAYNGHAFLGKFDLKNGDFVDSTLFGYQSAIPYDIENALGMTTDGEFLYITGYTTPQGPNNWQIFVSKFNKNLEQQWYVDWGGKGNESARGIQVENGIIYIAGLTESEELLSGKERDALLLKFDTSGRFMDYQTYSGKGKASFRDLAVSKGDIYLVGTNEIGTTKQSFLLALLDTTSTDAKGPSNEKQLLYNFYPNPASGLLHVNFPQEHSESLQIELFDVKGRVIYSLSHLNDKEEEQIPIQTSGMFILKITYPNYSVRHRIINY